MANAKTVTENTVEEACTPIQGEFSFTNTTLSTSTLPLYDLQLGNPTQYGKGTDLSTKYVCKNLNTNLSAGDEVYFTFTKIEKISSPFTNYYPPKVKQGIDFGVHLDTMVIVCDGKGTLSSRTDYPMNVEIKFQCPVSGNVTADMALELLERAVSALVDAKASGEITSDRLNALMHGGLTPPPVVTTSSDS